MIWTDETDALLKEGIAKGLSAAQIGNKIGVTRNAILGRTFRLGLSIPRKGTYEARKGAPSTIKPKIKNLKSKARIRINPEDYVDQIMDLRDMGWTWHEIALQTGLTVMKCREIAIVYGGYVPKQINQFTPEEIDYLIAEWAKHTPAEVIADNLGRSFGVIRQKALQLSRTGKMNVKRDPAKTRLIRTYGEQALAAGQTPSEALHNIALAKQRAFAEAIQIARQNAQKYRSIAVEKMLSDIENGVERDEAIFAARAEGANLQDVAEALDITRERVRQICFKMAEIIALRKLTEKK